MVMEYMCHGDLLGFLRASRGHLGMYTVFPGEDNNIPQVNLTSRDLMTIAANIASGMAFLAERKVAHTVHACHMTCETTPLLSRDQPPPPPLSACQMWYMRPLSFLPVEQVVHGSLCASNVLVGTSLDVKINLRGYELSRDSVFKWMAPETLFDGILSTSCDM